MRIPAELATLDLLELRLERTLGGELRIEIERGVDPVARLVEISPKRAVRLLADVLHEVLRVVLEVRAR